MFDCPCVILAGGKSSRMGKDKALLPFKGYKSLSEFQYKRLEKIFSKVFISTKEDKFDFEATLILDKNEDFSPMNALYKILKSFHKKSVFIISVDTPFCGIKEIKKMYDFTKDYDIIIPKTSSQTHQLCGFYHSKLAKKCKDLYENDIHKIYSILKDEKVKFVDFKNEKAFLNLNYFSEYEKASSKIYS